jgi:hypothetical protein
METVAVVPIFVNAGAAALPTILAVVEATSARSLTRPWSTL